MTLRSLRSLGALVVASALLFACSQSGQGSAPGGSSLTPEGSTHFRQATTSERSARERSLTVGSRVMGKDRDGNPGYYTLVDALSTDDSLDFSEVATGCVTSVFRAPWYVALGNFSIPLPSPQSLNNCSAPAATPTPTPIATSAAARRDGSNDNNLASGLYIVQVDVGLFSLSVTPLEGPATQSSDPWTFDAISPDAQFQFLHFYAFFVASWTPGSTPAPTPTPTPSGAGA